MIHTINNFKVRGIIKTEKNKFSCIFEAKNNNFIDFLNTNCINFDNYFQPIPNFSMEQIIAFNESAKNKNTIKESLSQMKFNMKYSNDFLNFISDKSELNFKEQVYFIFYVLCWINEEDCDKVNIGNLNNFKKILSILYLLLH